MNALAYWSNAVAEAFREYRECGPAPMPFTVQRYARRELRALRLVRFWNSRGQHRSPGSLAHE
jgi:hypothetical protein